MANDSRQTRKHRRHRKKRRHLPTPQELAFAHHYANPQSPGFSNRGRSAELAGYAGEPGSNQLSVQGHRLLKRQSVWQEVETELARQGFTPRRIARLLLGAMGAKQPKDVFDEQGKRVTKMFDDHRIQLLGLEMTHKICPTKDELPKLTTEQLVAVLQQLPEEERKEIFRKVEKISEEAVAGTHQAAASPHSPADRRLMNDALEQVRSVTDGIFARIAAKQQQPATEAPVPPVGKGDAQ